MAILEKMAAAAAAVALSVCVAEREGATETGTLQFGVLFDSVSIQERVYA